MLKIRSYFLAIFALGILALPAAAEFRTVQLFKKIAVPFNLKHEGVLIEKGIYDFEVCADRSLNTWILKIKKKGKAICVLQGEVLRSENPGGFGMKTATVPDKPRLKMKKSQEENMIDIIFENSGMDSGTMLFPYYIVRFKSSIGADS